MIYSSNLIYNKQLNSIHNTSLYMYMILTDFLSSYSYRALLPVDHDPPWHVYLSEFQELPNKHYQHQDTWRILITLTKRHDVNGRCCKQTNFPNNKIMHVFIYIHTCARITNFAKAIHIQINIHKLMEAKRIYNYIYLSFLLIHN